MKICANQEWKLWANSLICLKRETEGAASLHKENMRIFTNGLKCTDKEPKNEMKGKQHPGGQGNSKNLPVWLNLK